MPGARRPARSRSRILLRLWLAVLAALVAFVGPRLVRAHSSLQWTRHHALQAPDPIGHAARGAARSASVVVKEAAPLPWAAEAARTALDVGARHEVANPAAALALYVQVGGALEPVVASRWRRYGLEALLEEARRRERDLRARPDVVKSRQ